MISDGLDAIPRIAEILGIPADLIRKIVIEISYDNVTTVQVEALVSEEAMETITKEYLVRLEERA